MRAIFKHQALAVIMLLMDSGPQAVRISKEFEFKINFDDSQGPQSMVEVKKDSDSSETQINSIK